MRGARALNWLIPLFAFALGAVAVRLVLPWLGSGSEPLRGMAAAPCPPLADYPGSAAAEIDWTGLCRWREDNTRLIAAGTRPEVVFLGDSIAEFWGEYDPAFYRDGRVNRGVAGQTSAQQLARFRLDVVALKPRLVLIMGGLNDIAGNGGLSTPETFAANVESMADLAEAHGIGVILATIPPADDFDKPGRVRPQPWIAELNRRLAALAARRGLVLADFHAALAGADGAPRREFYADYGHPNAAGYAALRGVALAAIGRASGEDKR